MKMFSILSRRLILSIVLPLLTLPPAASGATAPPAAPRAVAPQPTGPGAGIIALPLNPVVPATLRSCAARTPSGLGYAVLRPATGAKPAATDVALVNYIGYLAATGIVFDQSMQSPLPVDGVIPGFAEGLRMMATTGITRFCVPAAMGYGAQASGVIPANADLVFQVELLDHKTAAEVARMRDASAAEPAGQ